MHDLEKLDELQYFSYHQEKEKDVVEFCLGIMKRDFPDGFDKVFDYLIYPTLILIIQ